MAKRFAMVLTSALCVAPSFANAPPSLEFLEFLADWQDESGELVDPFALPEALGDNSVPEEKDNGEK